MAREVVRFVNIKSDYSGNPISERDSGVARVIVEFKSATPDGKDVKHLVTIPDIGVQEFAEMLSKIEGATITPHMAANDIAFREMGKDSGKSSSGGSTNSKLMPGKSTEDVREWARVNGFPVNDRGRLPGGVIGAFNEAHGYKPVSAEPESEDSEISELESEEIEIPESESAEEPTEEEIATVAAEFSAAPEPPKAEVKPRAPRPNARAGARTGR